MPPPPKNFISPAFRLPPSVGSRGLFRMLFPPRLSGSALTGELSLLTTCFFPVRFLSLCQDVARIIFNLELFCRSYPDTTNPGKIIAAATSSSLPLISLFTYDGRLQHTGYSPRASCWQKLLISANSRLMISSTSAAMARTFAPFSGRIRATAILGRSTGDPILLSRST